MSLALERQANGESKGDRIEGDGKRTQDLRRLEEADHVQVREQN